MIDSPVVEVRSVSKQFKDTRAISDISFVVGRGSTTGLLGGNGAGKTTTLAILLGLLLPTSGSVRVLGEDMVHHRHRVLARMNFSSPYVDLPRRLTVEENLIVYGRLYGVRDLPVRIRNLATDLEISDLLKKPTGTLSSGQRTRVALAKALLNDPELLLLDEPTASLDPDVAMRVRDRLEHMNTEHRSTLLLTSHDMREVAELTTRVVFLRRGRIIADGPPDEVVTEHGYPDLEAMFLAEAARLREEAV